MTDDICGAECTDGTPCENNAGSCPWHGEGDSPDNGRPTKLDDETWDDCMAAAEQGLTLEGIARVAGIGVSTLREWREHRDDFSAALSRARARGERRLIQDADAEFILERSYGYTKSQDVDVSGDGVAIVMPEDAADY
jgi:hypothetical protein